MNAAYILIALGALFIVLRLWDDPDETIGDDAPAVSPVSAQATSRPGHGDGWRLRDSWIARLTLILAGLALAFAVEIGPGFVIEGLARDDVGPADAECPEHVVGAGTGPGAEAARALVMEHPDVFCSP